jgi:cytochrome P450
VESSDPLTGSVASLEAPSASPAPAPGSSLPPGPRMPAWMQTSRWMFRPTQFMEHCRERYGRLFTLRLGPGQAVIMVAEPRLAKKVMAGDAAVFRAGDTNGIFRPVVGSNSILLLDGDAHMRQRKILLPSMGAAHAAQFAEAVREIAQKRLSGWEVGQRLNMQEEMEAISFDSIMRVVFGEHSDDTHPELRSLIPEMMDRCDSPFTLMPWFRRELAGSSPFGRLMRTLDEIDSLLFEIIAQRRVDPMTQFREDVVSLLLRASHEDGTPLSDREVRDEVLTMIMAGYETTTSGCAWAIERLMRSPEQLARLTAEVETGSDSGYLNAVVKETLRARPVVPVVARHLAADVELDGYEIPAGSTLMVSIYLIHNDEAIYPAPDEFRPERFLDHTHEEGAWIPFGGGVRRCLGARFAELEMKVVLAQVLASARLEPAGRRAEGTKRKRFTLAPEHGAAAVVAQLVPAESKLGTRRFRRQAFPAARGSAGHAR